MIKKNGDEESKNPINYESNNIKTVANKTSRGLRNNNPGNIRLSRVKYEGEITPSKDNQFKQFQTIEYGYRAIFVLLATYFKKYKLNTINQWINRYAPSSENQTNIYIDVVAKSAGIDKNCEIDIKNKTQMVAIVKAISKVENGSDADNVAVNVAWNLYNN